MGGTIRGRPSYEVHLVERKWQERWRREGCFTAAAAGGGPREYHVAVGPPATGRLHLGHVRMFALGDVMARAARQRGCDVLYAFQWDAFGPLTERAAEERGASPARAATEAAERMAADLARLGVSVDWRHVRLTSDPRYYRWTQWLFLQLHEHGLVYRGMAMLNYCTGCQATPAHVEVVDGTCRRCGTAVERRETPRWFVRLSQASGRLLDGIPALDGWSPTVRRLLSGFIGAVAGHELDVAVGMGGSEEVLTVFVPDGQAAGPVDAVLVAPGHPEVARLLRGGGAHAAALVDRAALRRRRRDSIAEEVVDTGLHARLPGSSSWLPVFASTSLDPAFARGATLRAARAGGVSWGPARPVVHHRVQDWVVSRQRSWGTPIPVVQCPTCGDVPLPADRLPLELELDGDGARRLRPLPCPRCGEPAHPDPDTGDCFFDMAWAVVAGATSLPADAGALFAEVARWAPATWLHHGLDAFLYAHLHRFVAHVLHDLGYLDEPEPVEHFHGHGMVTVDGRRPSAQADEAVDAAGLLDELGADLLRLRVLWAANPLRPLDFRPRGDDRAANFLAAVRALVLDNLDLLRAAPADDAGTSSPMAEEIAACTHEAVERVTRFLDHYRPRTCLGELGRFLSNLGRARTRLDDHDAAARRRFAAGVRALVQLLGPFAPHLAEELWEAMGEEVLLAEGRWPTTSHYRVQADDVFEDRLEEPVRLRGGITMSPWMERPAATVGAAP